MAHYIHSARGIDPIPERAVTFHPHSFCDAAGRLFRWNGQLYRGIRPDWTPFFTGLFHNGVIRRLIDQGLLIETELTSLAIDGYEMVVHHRDVPFPSYPEEWCTAMLKDAALTILKLLTELAQCGLTLKDAHPWNVLFDASKPVYVDFTSIVPMAADCKWSGYEEFCRFCLHPLLLMSHGQGRIARRLLPEHEGVQKSELLMLTKGSVMTAPVPFVMKRGAAVLQQLTEPFRPLLSRALRPIDSIYHKEVDRIKSHVDFLEKLRREIESIPRYYINGETGADRYDPGPSLSDQDDWTAERRCLHKVLSQLRPGSVLNIGGKVEWYSRLAAVLGSRVVAFDTDEQSITKLYDVASKNCLPILPLLIDFADPTPSRGLLSHWAISATERFQCDMVLALNLVNRVIHEHHLDFDQIVDGLALFSKRWLVVKFVISKDQPACPDKVSWYTLDNFINVLKKRFPEVSILSAYADPHVLLLCEK